MRLSKVMTTIWDSVIFRLFLIIANVWFLMVHLWGLRPFGTDIDVERAGPLADWFTGVLTFGAVCVAALTLRSQQEKFNDEIMDRERERQQTIEVAAEGKRQAARLETGQVYAWIQRKEDMWGRPTGLELHLENRTPIPVYEWALQVEGQELRASSETDGPIVPGHTLITRISEEWLPVVQSDAAPRVELTFQAANGEVLQRLANGNIDVKSNRLLTE